ncbi:Putative alpha-mannosidase [Klebsiella pneumoniae]|nr:Putative alpha-mannosidase [Klebsiella pneumoniae]
MKNTKLDLMERYLIILDKFVSKISESGVPQQKVIEQSGNDSNLLIVFYVQIMPDDFVMQLHRF